MKVYVAVENPFNPQDNPYVRTLINGINRQYSDVEWGYGISLFWNDECFNYDIVHIHWPHYLCHKLKTVDALEFRLELLKEKGVKIVSTCHNLEPHYSGNPLLKQAYDVVYKKSDCIFHLGKYSKELFSSKYPFVDNQLLLHHVYDDLYKEFPSREECLKKLNLDSAKLYVLCFGAFRSNEERNLIINLSNELRGKNIEILAPSFYKVVKRRNLICVLKSYLKYYFYKIRYKNIRFQNDFVKDSDLVYYYGAAFVSLIHRLKILNSGNVPLGFLMKKVIVGPKTGNVGIWLEETGNFTFDPNNLNEISRVIEYIIENKIDGISNYDYAITNLTTQNISNQLYQHYKRILM